MTRRPLLLLCRDPEEADGVRGLVGLKEDRNGVGKDCRSE